MPINVLGSFEDAFEQGVSTVKQQAKQQAASTAKSVATQVTGTHFGTPNDSQVPSADTAKVVQDLGGQAMQQAQQAADPAQAQAALQEMEVTSQKDQSKKLEETRQKLKLHNQQHKNTYFDPTFNKQHKEPTVQERLQAEQQQEEQKKMVDLEEKKKKEEPIALTRAKRTAETNRGVAG